MKALEILMKSNWDFILYKTNEGLVLNVTTCNSFVDVTRSYMLTNEESNLDFEGVKQLAEEIRKNHESHKDREVPLVTLS